ncbi:diguanylate cyclase with GGDEF domain [Nitrospirillum amazonense]|uniref:Diguanylate cyclase with GGDEF domain n=1 Tax=Nitrospirillum amazonense TaxID=28077 RepID=A0A560EL39_9PROT|nr:diguanylate cyclase with GGDEF domain [Nitrospirillum amazonense]
MNDRLRSILAGRSHVAAGSVQMIGLDSLKVKLGERWTAVRSKVLTLAERLLADVLSPHDVFFRHGEGTFVIVFAQLGNREASLICGRIIEDLQRLLLGESDTSTIQVTSVVGIVDGTLHLQATSLDELLEAVAKSMARPASEQQVSSGTAWAEPWRSVPAEAVEVMYQPAWDVTRQVLFLYIARARRMRGNHAFWGTGTLLGTSANPMEVLDLDLVIIQGAIETYLELYENRFRFFLSLPVHYESISVNSRRQQVIDLVGRIPAHLRPFLNYRLEDLPDGIPEGRLRELINCLRPFGRSVTVATKLQSRDLPTFAAAGATGVVATLPGPVLTERIAIDLAYFASSAQKLRLGTLLEGVEIKAAEAAATAAGINFLAGDFIGPWTAVPGHVIRKPRHELGRGPGT